MKNSRTIIYIVIVVIVLVAGYFLYRYFNNNPPTYVSGRRNVNDSPFSPSPTNPSTIPTSQTLTRISKNNNNKLSVVYYKSDTREITNSKELTFDEAIKVTGSADKVCLAANGGFGASGYEECSRIRRA